MHTDSALGLFSSTCPPLRVHVAQSQFDADLMADKVDAMGLQVCGVLP